MLGRCTCISTTRANIGCAQAKIRRSVSFSAVKETKRSRVMSWRDCLTKSSPPNTGRFYQMKNSSQTRLRKPGDNWRRAENQNDHDEHLAKAFSIRSDEGGT